MSTDNDDYNDIDYVELGKDLGKTFATVLLYFFISSAVLFYSKIAEVPGLIPTDQTKFPYVHLDTSKNVEMLNSDGNSDENSNPTPKPNDVTVTTDIFLATPPGADEEMSQKLEISNKGENRDNGLIEAIRDIKTNSTASSGATYITSLILGTLARSYSSYKTIFGVLGKYMPEIVVIMIGPIVLLICILSNLVLVIQYFMLMISNLGWFLKKNTNTDESQENPIWEDVELIKDPGLYGLGIFEAFMFTILGIIIIIPVLLISIISPLFSLASYNAKMGNKKVSIKDIAAKVFSYNRVIISLIYCLLAIKTIHKHANNAATIIGVLISVLMFFQIIPNVAFKSVIPGNLSPLTDADDKEIKGGIQKGGSKCLHDVIKRVGKRMKNN
jgi:hypothetical protein